MVRGVEGVTIEVIAAQKSLLSIWPSLNMDSFDPGRYKKTKNGACALSRSDVKFPVQLDSDLLI